MSYFEDEVEPYIGLIDDRMVEVWYAIQEAAEREQQYKEAAAKFAAEYKRKLNKDKRK